MYWEYGFKVPLQDYLLAVFHLPVTWKWNSGLCEAQKNRAKRVQICREVCRQGFMCFEVVVLAINIISFINVEVMNVSIVDFEMLEQLHDTFQLL
jgi:hypothetical protein